MRDLLKLIARNTRWLLKIILLLFFEGKYIRGRHFDTGISGFLWGFSAVWQRNILRLAPPMPFPASLCVRISNPKNIQIHPDDINNFQSPGLYLQNSDAIIVVGKGTYIGPNVGIITANHSIENLDVHSQGENVELGEMCWVGMNSVLLPGVKLGPHTIVGAGSIVTKSFPRGNCVIAGNPAKMVKDLIVKP